MRKVFPYFLILLLVSVSVFLIVFRSEPVKFNEVIIPGKFSISIPDFLVKALPGDSSLVAHYENEKKQVFLLIYQEPDTSHRSLQIIFTNFSNNFISRVEQGHLLKYYPEKINGCNAFIGNIRGKINGNGVYYRIAAIKSNNNYYEFIFGVLDDDQLLYEDDMAASIRSFKVIGD